LPWQGLKAYGKKEKYEKIADKKQSTPILDLCKDLPCTDTLPVAVGDESMSYLARVWRSTVQFQRYLQYCQNLAFNAPPDYAWLRRLFRELFYSEGYHLDWVYDWTKVDSVRNLG